MKNRLQTAHIFYGIAIAGLGIQQFIYKGFLPVILPVWPVWLHKLPALAFLTGAIFIVTGAMIVLNKGPKIAGLFRRSC